MPDVIGNHIVKTKYIPVWRIVLLAWVCWTLFLVLSLSWSVVNENRAVIKQATSEAAGHFNKDVAYRRWATMHGGVYVPVNETTQPNPYLAHVPERDIETPTGRQLTLMNPAYMTRQTYELAEQQYGVRGHITSLNVLRPLNVPDDWETQALKAFESGPEEVSEMVTMDGEQYLRFMRPFITEKGCLACHASQGYREGDIRGGISVSVPMKGYFEIRRANVVALSSWHALIWAFGSSLLGFGGRFLQRRADENVLAFAQIKQDQDHFRSLLTLSQMKEASEADLVDFALAEVIRLNGSQVGYLHYYDETRQMLHLFRWDQTTLANCTVPDLSRQYPLERSGVWADCIRLRKPVVHNDYNSLGDQNELPEGHFPIERHMSVPIMDGENIVGLMGIGNKPKPYLDRDVTQVSLYASTVWEIIKNRRAQLDIKEREQKLLRFRSLVDHSNDAIFIVSVMDGWLLDVNLRACEMLGYTHDELLSMRVPDLDANLPGDFDWAAHVREVKSQGQVLLTGRHRSKDGQLIPVEINLRVLRLEDGEYMIAAVRDIRKRLAVEAELEQHRRHLEELVQARTADLEERTRELEKSQTALQYLLEDVNEGKRELEAANSKLQELDQLKSMFIASMSHELRTPLNAIIGFSSLILNGMTGAINEEQRDQLERVYRSGKHLLSLITDVIDIAKIESGRIQPDPIDFPLAEMLDEACDSVNVQCADKGLDLVRDCPKDPILLHSDRKRLLQCLLNYLSNAVKFTEKGRVKLVVREDHETVTFCVVDSGIGIAPEDQSKLFHSFVRLESVLKTTTPGTGLGLYLTKKLATEVLCGDVWMESALGEGSRFCLKIPKVIDGSETQVVASR